jgi:hypothetical protein
MKYRLTPLNIFCALLAGVEIVLLTFPGSLKKEHYGYQHIYLIPIILTGLLIDYILQRSIKKYPWLIFLESMLIAATILLNVRL